MAANVRKPHAICAMPTARALPKQPNQPHQWNPTMNESLNFFTGQQRARALLMMAAMVACTALHAQSRFEEDFDDKDKPWQEIAVQLPAAPKAENLIPFTVNANSPYIFAIDAKSLTVGDDFVVRYTMVAKSAAGGENISYEGIRCKVKEKKLYAFGRKDGTWSRSRRDQWKPFSQHAGTPHQATLAQDFFCIAEGVSDTAEGILRKMRTRTVTNNQFNR
jgi:hypothetical protein